MDYVKGCDINTLSKFGLKRIANGKLKIIESLQDTLTYDSLSAMLTEAKTDFVNSDGKTIKDMPTAEIFYMTKKIDKKKLWKKSRRLRDKVFVAGLYVIMH